MGNLRLIRIVLFLMFIFVLTAAPVFSAVSVISGPDLVSTTFHDEETPTIVLDASGNAHIVWTSQGGLYLYYKMVDESGNVIVGPTNLNPATNPETSHVRRPSAEIDASGDIHIVFHGFSLYTDFADEEYTGTSSLDASEVIYTKIDPAAYIAGGQSDLDDLVEITETIISTNDGEKSRAPNAALDGSGRLHVTWFDDLNGLAIHYRVLDLNGGQIAAETVLTTGLVIDIDYGEPEIAVDGNGSGHIVYSTQGSNSEREIYYTMVGVSGSTISVLIDDTRITADDGTASVKAHLATDSGNQVHVVWHNGADEVFYSKLNPYLDDRDGGTADSGVISLIQENRATPDNGQKSNQKNIAVDDSGRLHLAYADGDEWSGPRDLYYIVLDTSSTSLTVVEPATLITDEDPDFYPCYWVDSSSRHPEVALGSDGRVFITFSAYAADEEDYDIFLSILRTSDSSTPIPTLSEWGVILMSLLIFGASIRMIRKNRVNP